MRNYTAMVYARHGLTPLQRGIGDHSVIQVVFLPSFHPEVAIELAHSREGWSVELRTYGTNLFQHDQYQAALDKGGKPGWDPPQAPILTVKRGDLPCHLSDSISQLESTIDLAEWDDGGFGLDGMTAQCRHRDHDGDVKQVEIRMRGQWEAPVPHKLVNELFNAATTLLPDSVVQYGYLDRGLPAAVVGDNPTTARIFGGLGSDDESDLTAFLRDLPVDEPVLVDMSNFGSMGTLLDPQFQEFLTKRRARTVWLVSESARKHLTAAGIPEESMTDTRDAALDLLEK